MVSILDEIQSKRTIVTWINHELKFDPYCCSVLQIDLKSVCSTLQQVSIELFNQIDWRIHTSIHTLKADLGIGFLVWRCIEAVINI